MCRAMAGGERDFIVLQGLVKFYIAFCIQIFVSQVLNEGECRLTIFKRDNATLLITMYL